MPASGGVIEMLNTKKNIMPYKSIQNRNSPQYAVNHQTLRFRLGSVSSFFLYSTFPIMPSGGPAALMDGTAQALTARRRMRKSDMSRGGCLFKDRDRVYISK